MGGIGGGIDSCVGSGLTICDIVGAVGTSCIAWTCSCAFGVHGEFVAKDTSVICWFGLFGKYVSLVM